MKLKNLIEENYKQALKNRDEHKVSALRLLISAIKNKEIEKRPKEILETDVFEVINKLIKQHKESIQQFSNGGRQDLVKQEEEQLKVIQEFMPKQLSEEEITQKAHTVIDKVQASGIGDFGIVMKELMSEIKGKVDGKIVSNIVKNILSNLK